MVMDQKAREAVQKVDSFRDGCELLRIAKQKVGKLKVVVGGLVVLEMKVGRRNSVWMIERKSGSSIWKS